MRILESTNETNAILAVEYESRAEEAERQLEEMREALRKIYGSLEQVPESGNPGLIFVRNVARRALTPPASTAAEEPTDARV